MSVVQEFVVVNYIRARGGGGEGCARTVSSCLCACVPVRACVPAAACVHSSAFFKLDFYFMYCSFKSQFDCSARVSLMAFPK